MIKIKLTQVSRENKVSATSGKPYVRMLIKCQEHGDKLLSGFGGQDNAHWKAGDEVEVDIEEIEKNGTKYLNFKTLKKGDKADEKLEMILNRIVGLQLRVETVIALLSPKTDPYPTPEDEGIDVSDVPF